MLKQELEKRLNLLQQEMNRHRLDAYVVASGENIWYLSDLTYSPEERPFFIVVPAAGKPTLIVPKLEELHLYKRKPIDCDVDAYWEYPSPAGSSWYDVLQNVLKSCKSVGTESGIRADQLSKIEAQKVVQVDLIDEIRKTKSPFELERIRDTAAHCDRAMEKVFKTTYIGASIVEPFTLSRSIQTGLIRSNSFNPITTALLTAVWPAPTSAMPHSIPGFGETLDKGPNVTIIYLRINGYAAECERTFFLGKPTREDEEHFHHMMQARDRALKVLKAGVHCGDVDLEAKNYLVQKGYSDNLLHRTGHGIGLRNHEGPWVAEGSDEVLMENTVISIEPGIYIDGTGGYRHSDTVLITAGGYELLTRFPVQLSDMIITRSNLAARIKGKIVRKMLKL